LRFRFAARGACKRQIFSSSIAAQQNHSYQNCAIASSYKIYSDPLVRAANFLFRSIDRIPGLNEHAANRRFCIVNFAQIGILNQVRTPAFIASAGLSFCACSLPTCLLLIFLILLLLLLRPMLMNRRTDDVEELLELARESIHREDFTSALKYLRRASSEAPLRQDIRQILAALLEEVSSGPDEPLVYSEARHFEDERDDELHSDSQFGSAAPAVERQTHAFAVRALNQDLSEARQRTREALRNQSAYEEAVRESETDEEPQGTGLNFLQKLARKRALESAEYDEHAVSEFDDEQPRPGIIQSFFRRMASLATPVEEDDGEELQTRMDHLPAVADKRSMRDNSKSDHRNTWRSESEEHVARERSGRGLLEHERNDPGFVLYSEMSGVQMPESGKPRRKRTAEISNNLPDENSGVGGSMLLANLSEYLLSRGAAAHYGIYAAIVLWIMLSSSFSYMKFFRAPGLKTVASAAVTNSPADESVNPEHHSKVSKADEELVKLASHYISSSRYDAAIELLEPVANKSDSASSIRQTLAIAYDSKATSLLESNKLKDAAKYYSKAAEQDPEKPDYLVRLGNAYWYCGTMLGSSTARDYFQKSLASLKSAIDRDKKNLVAYQRLASVYESMEQVAQAKETYGKIIKLAPSSSEAELAGQRLKTLSMAN
jgi:tetratricopeptide (TPR) repeat protein